MAQDLFYVSATRAREGLIVITSDRFELQESIAVSGDRQSASELAQRAASTTPTRTLTSDDLFRLYEAQQAQQRQPQRILKQEIHHHVDRNHAGLGIGF